MIEVRGLTKRYGGAAAVDGVSFTVNRGDIFGFIGPNGAGKTTTIRILSTLLDPTEGDILVEGRSVTTDPYGVRRILGYMPDVFEVYDRITVWEYLDFFGAAFELPRRERHRIIEDVLVLTDLAGHRERLPSDLSKGMKQRLCLAKTLIHDPKVLVLDEPASALDPRARIEFRALLKELRTMGKTILLSSHILTELSDVCNAVAILEKGRLVAAGPIESIQAGAAPGAVPGAPPAASPLKAWQITLLDRVDEARAVLEGAGFSCQVAPAAKTITFGVEGGAARVAEAVKALALKDIPIVGLQERQQDLESLFMQLTKGEVS